MPRRLEEAFSQLLVEVTPAISEDLSAISLRGRIKECLEHRFAMVDLFLGGSFADGTALRGASQRDLFAVIPGERLRIDSAASLQAMKLALQECLPTSQVMVRSPAVVVPFGNDASASITVVPSEQVGHDPTRRTLLMPDRAGGWMLSSPQAYCAWLDANDKRHGGQLRSLIKLLKAWSVSNDTGLRSFWIELRTAQWAAARTAIKLHTDIHDVLRHMIEYAHAIPDPLDVGPPIAACALGDFTGAFAKVRAGAARAALAGEAASRGRLDEAFAYWESFFGGRFPSHS